MAELGHRMMSQRCDHSLGLRPLLAKGQRAQVGQQPEDRRDCAPQ